jgi:hypothetical protein
VANPEPTAGDILIISHWGVIYDVARLGGDIIERTTSRQAALAVAFRAAPRENVWFVEVGGRPERISGVTASQDGP